VRISSFIYSNCLFDAFVVEVKSSRAALPKSVAIPPSYHSFFSFPVKKTGYSGVAVYSRIDAAVPLKAEEGLTGLLQPKIPLDPEERVSRWENYPPQQEHSNLQDGSGEKGEGDIDYKLLDGEGRALVIDFGLFVLINTYCPNDSSTPTTSAAQSPTLSRGKYKKQYHQLLSYRVDSLIKNEERQVIVLGDINACAAIIDHCEGDIMVSRARKANNLEKGDESGFWDCEGTGEGRKWLSNWLYNQDGTGGPMIDVVRRFWPERRGMYTCTFATSHLFTNSTEFFVSGWNTKLSARETNYGTRIDYILVTPGLIPWIKAANIQPEIKGSDHCPVYIDLYDEITADDGTRTKLQDVMGDTSEKEPPRMATRFWEEHSGKQMSLDKFFGGNKAKGVKDPTDRVSPVNAPQTSARLSSSEISIPIASTMATAASTSCPEADTAPQCTIGTPADMLLALPSHFTSSSAFTTRTPDPLSPSTSAASETALTSAASVPASTIAVSLASSSQPRKRKIVPEPHSSLSSTSKKKKTSKAAETKNIGQAKLSSFFDKPPTATATKTKASSSSNTTANRSKTSVCVDDVIHIDDDDIIDVDSAPPPLSSPSSSQNISSLSQSSFHSPIEREKIQSTKEEAKQIWNSVFLNANDTPKPKCSAHGEPAKEYTVNKPGANKGKKFWLCSR
jgi:AP endonuclease-2